MKKSILASTPFLILNKSLLVAFGIDANVVLSHLYQQQNYFKEQNQLLDGMFFCTTENIGCVTTLSYYQIKQAINTLTKWGIIKVKRKGVPAKLYFQIDESQILKNLNSCIQKTSILDCENFNIKTSKNLNSINNNKVIRLDNNTNTINSISSHKEKFINEVRLIMVNTKFHNEFIDYWTEENSKGKMRWQLEKTWNTKLRLGRWAKNNFAKSSSTNDPKYPDYYDIHFAKRLEQDESALKGYFKYLESLGYEKKVNTYDGKTKWFKR
tara:strand:+ start:134 stop:937 length:804 start_codon:yes stop_codon:yes gene_type:complete